MPRFFIDTTLDENSEITLNAEVLRHILVLRLKLGDTIDLFNGNTKSYTGIITLINRKEAKVKIIKQQQVLPAPCVNIDLYLSIIANDKMDLAIQKATELGVNSIHPIITSRSHKLHLDKIATRIKHWQKIIHSSCEQSGNNFIPVINPPLNLTTVFANNSQATKIILLPNSNIINCDIKQHIDSVDLLIGPEGGFSPDEVTAALANQYQPLQLGNLILRSETAVVAGMSFIHTQYGQWHRR
jgi:16S rRNA (uracil1498-N3)-methyltransferase